MAERGFQPAGTLLRQYSSRIQQQQKTTHHQRSRARHQGYRQERICLSDWNHHGAGMDAIHRHASHRFQRRHQRG